MDNLALALDIFLWASLGASILLVLMAEIRYRNWKANREAQHRAIMQRSVASVIPPRLPRPGAGRIHRVTDLTTGLSIDAESFTLPNILTVMQSHRQWMAQEITDGMAQSRHESRVMRKYATLPHPRGWEVAG